MRFPASVAVIWLVVAVAFGAAQSQRTLNNLGRIDPPRYASPLTRAGEASSVFDAAMSAYRARQYERAADMLRRFVTVEPEDAAGNFYLAVSLMMTDDVGEAEDRLGVVLAAEPGVFEMPARWVLGKALVRLGRLADGERQLRLVAQSSDVHAREAAQLADRVRELERR